MRRSLLLFSPALALAVATAQLNDPEPCPACLEPENAGLCHRDYCQRILPTLKPSKLSLNTHSGRFELKPPPAPIDKTDATVHADKMAAQSSKRLAALGRAAATGQRRKVYHRRSRAS